MNGLIVEEGSKEELTTARCKHWIGFGYSQNENRFRLPETLG